MDGMDDIVREFIVESYENLDQLDQDLVALEDQPGSRDLLGSGLPHDPHDQGHERAFLPSASLSRSLTSVKTS